MMTKYISEVSVHAYTLIKCQAELYDTKYKMFIFTNIFPIIGALGQWMEEGSVDLTITRVNMLGAPGAGKTCAECLLLNEDPPSDNVSTPIARPTVRATRVAVEDQTKWKRVTTDDLLEELAANLTASADKTQKIEIEPAAPKVSSTKSTDDSKQEIKEEPSVPEVASVGIDHSPSLAVPVPVTPHMPPPPDQPSSDTIIKEDQAPTPNYRSEEVIQKILSARPKGIRLSDHWLYVIDSGGQPAYQELLPLFTRAASLNIITLDLSKSFEEKFKLEYRIGGKYFPCHSKSTQLAIFQSAVSTGATFKPLDISHVTRKPTHSMHLVLGTHYDKDLFDYRLRKREGSLQSAISTLQPYLRDCVIRKPNGSIIFPVNTMAKSRKRAKYNKEICQAIQSHGSAASLEIKIPIQWFAFELSLPADKSIIPIEEALSIGQKYGMSEDNTKQALRYFHDVGLKLYYPEVTGVVFIDPKPILEILSQLLALTYVNDDECCRDLILIKRLPQSVTNNLKEGFFNKDIFDHLKSKANIFLQPQFQLPDLVKLLLHLHIITEVEGNDEGSYFIPYALSSYDNLVSPHTHAKPLLIVWREEKYKSKQILPVPQGIFPLTIVHLLNQKQFEIPPTTKDCYKYRDAMSLKITFIRHHILHIINRYTHIEVYFTGPPEYCPQVRQLVIEAIDHSTEKMHMNHNHVTAFSCPKKKNCYCIVDEVHKVVNCTMCPKSADIRPDIDRYWCWFKSGKPLICLYILMCVSNL